FGNPEFRFRRNDFSIGDVNISGFIPFIRGIDHATVANDGGVHIRGAHRCSVLVPSFCGDKLLSAIAALSDCCPAVRLRDCRMQPAALRMSVMPGFALTSFLMR